MQTIKNVYVCELIQKYICEGQFGYGITFKIIVINCTVEKNQMWRESIKRFI